MIRQEEKTLVEYSNPGNKQNFSIKANAISFQILSSGLYSDKIQAIVRELCCNAFDAHVAANTQDTPIEIKLPTILDPTFYVKDYGIGLSDDQIKTLYTTYFDSTKTSSNDYIGALGLGSKSPFSYVNTFSVESRFNGTKTLYTCFIDESGLPSIMEMGSEETEEPNGLTITLSAKKDDTNKFFSAAKKVLMYFNPKPIVVSHPDFEPYFINHTFSGSNWKVRVSDWYASMRGPHLVQGFVTYPVDGSLLREQGLSKSASILSQINVDFMVDIGVVEVAASREALSYDARTIQNLVQIFETAASELRKSIQESFDKCTSQWEVGLLVNELEGNESYEFRNLYKQMNTDAPFTWQDKQVTGKVTIGLKQLPNMLVSYYTIYGSNTNMKYEWKLTHDSNPTGEYSFGVDRQTHIIVDTISIKGNRAQYNAWLNKTSRQYGNRRSLLIISPISTGSYNQDGVDDILKQLGNPTYHKAADIGIIKPKVVRTPIKKNKQERLRWVGFGYVRDSKWRQKLNRNFGPKCWTREVVDLNEGGFYVPVDRFSVMFDNRVCRDINLIIDHAYALGFIDVPKPIIYGFREGDMKSIVNDDKWINFIDYVTEKYNDADEHGLLSGRVVINDTLKLMGTLFSELILGAWADLKDKTLPGKFYDLTDHLYTMNTTTHQYDPKIVSELATILHSQSQTDTTREAVQTQVSKNMETWKEIQSQYKLLGGLEYYKIDIIGVEPIIEYINLIEKSLTFEKNVV